VLAELLEHLVGRAGQHRRGRAAPVARAEQARRGAGDPPARRGQHRCAVRRQRAAAAQLGERLRDVGARDPRLLRRRLDVPQGVAPARRVRVAGVRTRHAQRGHLQPARRLGLELRGAAPQPRRVLLGEHRLGPRGGRRRGARVLLERAPERLGECLAARRAVVGRLGQAAIHHRGERGADVRRHRAQRRRRPRDVRHEHRGGRRRVERQPPAQQLVRHHAQRVQVAAAVERLALHLLGAHVVHRAEHVAVDGQRLGRRLLGVARHAEVGDHRPAGGALDEHVLGLHVAVHHAARVRVGERPRHLAQPAHHVGRWQRPARPQPRAERLAVHPPHGEVGDPVALLRAIHGHDVRVRQPRRGARLAQEALPHRGVVRGGGGQHLERHRPVEARSRAR
jgi:hypothetical protein